MPKQFQLKIADPCHEDWNKMTTSEKGKYCGSCQKQVIDFTGMTDTQLATFFKKPSTGSVCGRFFDDQLDRKITVPRKQIPWINYFFQFTIPLFLASCTGNRTKGKVVIETVQKESTSESTLCTTTVGMIMPSTIEEIKTAPVEMMGDVGVVVGDIDIVEPPVSDVCSSLVVASDEKDITLNNSSGDSMLTRKQVEENRPTDSIPISNVLKFESTDSVFFSDSIWTAGLVGIYYEDISEPEILTVAESEPAFKIYANPARANSNAFIDAKKTEDGLYAIQLLNFSGQLIKQEQVRIEKGMGAITYSVPAIPSGNYLVVLVNKKTGKKITEKLIVQ